MATLSLTTNPGPTHLRAISKVGTVGSSRFLYGRYPTELGGWPAGRGKAGKAIDKVKKTVYCA